MILIFILYESRCHFVLAVLAVGSMTPQLLSLVRGCCCAVRSFGQFAICVRLLQVTYLREVYQSLSVGCLCGSWWAVRSPTVDKKKEIRHTHNLPLCTYSPPVQTVKEKEKEKKSKVEFSYNFNLIHSQVIKIKIFKGQRFDSCWDL